jgi:hypothetical protein
MSTSVTSVTKHFPSAQDGFTTTLSGTIASGATTVGLNSLTGYTTGEVAVFVVAPTATSEKQTFTGTVDTAGLQITNVVWTSGTNQTHAAGTTVVDYATATHMSMLSKGLKVEHNQNGTHGAVTATSVASTGAVSGTTGTFSGAVSGTTGTFTSDVTEKGATLSTIRSEREVNYVASGCVWTADAAGSTRNASMTSGVVYIAGKRLTVAAVNNRSFTASKDVFVDLKDNGDGTAVPVYYDNTTNAASPSYATTTGTFRLAIVVVGASSIASASSINQGELERTVPTNCNTYKTGQDSLGNLINNRNPNPTLTFITTFGILAIGSTSYRTMATIAGILPFRCKLYIFGTYSGRPNAAPAFSVFQNLSLSGYTSLESRLDSSVNSVPMTLTGEISATVPAGSFTVVIQDKMNSGGIEPFHGSIRVTAIPFY